MPADGWTPLACVGAAAAVSGVARAMTWPGAATGAVLGFAMAWGLGWSGFLMLLALLLVGTLVSRRGTRERTPLQALCNGGAAALAALAAAFGAPWGAPAAAGALAAALSDTVAGEAGQRWGGAPRMLLAGPVVPAGTDGAMTLVGTVAGLGAAFVVPAAGAFPLASVLALGAVGFACNVLDSVAGATIQRRLGARGNDLTNLAATVAGALLGAAAA